MITSTEIKARGAVEQIRVWGQGIDHEADLLISAGVDFLKELGKASDAIAKIRSDTYGVWLFRQDEYGQACEMLAEVEKHLQNARAARAYLQALHGAMRQGQPSHGGVVQ